MATTTASSISTPSIPSGSRRAPTASPTPGYRSRVTVRQRAVSQSARGSRTSATASTWPTASIRRIWIPACWVSTTGSSASRAPTESMRRCGSEPRRARDSSLLGHLREHTHIEALLGALLAELHLAGHLGEQRMVGAHTDVRAGTHRRAALTHADVARQHLLAAEALHAQALGVRIAAVLGTAACLFVCHD